MKPIFLLIALSIFQIIASQLTEEQIVKDYFPHIKKTSEDLRPKDIPKLKNIRFIIGDFTIDKLYYYHSNEFIRFQISNCFVHFLIDIYEGDGTCLKENYVLLIKNFKFNVQSSFRRDTFYTDRYYPFLEYYYSQIDMEIDYENFDNNILDVDADYIKKRFETLKYNLLEKFDEKWKEYIVEILLRYYSNGLISG